MEFLDCVKGRRSVRKYTDEKIGHDVFERIVEVASYSPSWKNTQIARYIVVENREILDKIADDCVMGFQYNTTTIKNAPALILVTYIFGRSGYERDGSFSTSKEDGWEMFDAGIATQTLSLAAHCEGLGSVIMGIFDESKIAKAVEIPENQKLAAIVAIGYPNEDASMPKRKSVNELICFK